MRRDITKVRIKESAQKLHVLMRQESDKYLYQRLHFLYLLKSGIVKTMGQASLILNIHRKNLSLWLRAYEQGGLEKLLDRQRPPGSKSSITPEIHQALKERLETKGFDSFLEARQFVEDKGVKLGYEGVRSYIHKHFKAKLKVPRPRHIRQKPEDIVDFKKNS